MAHLLQRPQTFSAACATLDRMTVCLSLSGEDTFSRAYSETMKTLLALLHSNLTPTKRRATVIDVLPHVLQYETDDTILGVTKVWKELLAMDSEPALQIACTTAFQERSVLPPFIIHEVWELCVALLTSQKNDEVRFSAGNTVLSIAERLDDEPWHREKIQTEYFPKALSMLFNAFVSHGTCGEIRVRAGLTLSKFSRVPENRVKLGRAVQDVWEGLVDMLFNRNEIWGGWDNIWVWEQDYDRQARVASQIIRDLSLTKQLGEAFFALPSLVERLLVAQVFEIAFRSTAGGDGAFFKTTRTLTFLHSIRPDPSLTAFPPWSQVLEVCGDGRGGQPQLEVEYLKFCRSQVETYLKLESYPDALAAIDVAEQHLKEVSETESHFYFARTTVSLVR